MVSTTSAMMVIFTMKSKVCSYLAIFFFFSIFCNDTIGKPLDGFAFNERSSKDEAGNFSLSDGVSAHDSLFDDFSVSSTEATAATLWLEDFSNLEGESSDSGTTSWSIANTGGGTTEVSGGELMVFNMGSGEEATWTSESIDISSSPYLAFSLGARSEGDMEVDGDNLDYVRVYYRLGGSDTEVLIKEFNGSIDDNNATPTPIFSGLIQGSSLEIIVRMRTTGTSEIYYLDNIEVTNMSSVWLEDFEDLPDEVDVDNGPTAWTVDDSELNVGTLMVQDGEFEMRGTTDSDEEGLGVWLSETIAVSGLTNVALSLNIRGEGTLDAGEDYLRVYYVLDDNGTELLFPNGDKDGAFLDDVLYTTIPSGTSSVQIIARNKTTGDNEHHYLDNITVATLTSGSVSTSVSGPISCAGNAQVFVSVTGGTATSYSWSGPNGFTRSEQNPMVQTAGSYSVVVTFSDGSTGYGTVDVKEAGSSLWLEDFTGLEGASSDSGTTSWSMTNTGGGTTEVSGEELMVFNMGSGEEAAWTSESIDISSSQYVAFSLDVRSEGDMEDSGDNLDYIQAYYKLDGSSTEVPIGAFNGSVNDNSTTRIFSGPIEGSSLEIVVRMRTTGESEIYYVDNVEVSGLIGAWFEKFEDLPNGVDVDNGATAWSVDDSELNVGTMMVQDGEFEMRGTTDGDEEGLGVWLSEVINISNLSDVFLSLNIRGEGSLDEGEDYLRVYYVLNDDGTELLFPNGDKDGAFLDEVLFASIPSGTSSVQIIARNKTTGDNEYHYLDNITVASLAVADNNIPVSASGAITCEGDAQLFASVTDGTPTSFSWSGPGGFASSEQNPTVSEPGRYAVLTTGSGGCKGYATIEVIEDKVPPGLEVTATSGSGSCGIAVILSAISTEGASYLWSGPNGFSSPSQNPSVTSSGTYQVTATSPANGCTSTTSITVNSASGGLLWAEDFSDMEGASSDSGATSWSISNTGGGTTEVSGEELMVFNMGSGEEATWTSGSIDISSSPYVGFSLDARSVGDMENSGDNLDYVRVYYRLDGSSTEVLIKDFNGSINDNSATPMNIFSGLVSGSSLEIVIRMRTTGTSEIYYLDNIEVGSMERVWHEDFNLANGTSVDNGETAWSASLTPHEPVGDEGDIFYAVSSNAYYTLNLDGELAWKSESIDISDKEGVRFSIRAQGFGDLDNADNQSDEAQHDYFRIFYSVDGGAEVPVFENDGPLDYTVIRSTEEMVGSQLQIILRIKTTGLTEYYGFDDVLVTSLIEGQDQGQGLDVTASVEGVLTCTNTEVTLIAETTGANATFSWEGPGDYTSTQQNPIVQTAGTYTVTVSSGECTASSEVIVSEDKNEPGVTVQKSEDLSCATSTVTISATSVSGATYQWIGPGTFASEERSVTVSEPGTYTVVATNPLNGCTSEDILIIAADTAELSVSLSVSDELTCATKTVTISATTSVEGALFAWSGPVDISSSESQVEVTIGGTYTVVVTNPLNGCTTEAFIDVSQNVTEPQLTFLLGGEGALSCAVPSLSITASSDVAATFVWNGPNTVNETGASINVTEPGDYTVVATNSSNGCISSDTVTVGEKEVDLGLTILAENNGELTCNASQLSLTASSSTTGLTYVWNGPNVVNVTGAVVSVNTPGTYLVVATDPVNECTAEEEFVVTGGGTDLDLTLSVSDILTCVRENVTLTASTSVSGALFAWSGPETINSTESTAVVSLHGTYQVKMTDPSSSCTATRSIEVILAEEKPELTFENVGKITCLDMTAVITTSTTASDPSYSWTGPELFTSTAPEVSVELPGTYKVTVTDGLTGCSDTFEVEVEQETTEPDLTFTLVETLPCTLGTFAAISTSTSVANPSYHWTGPGSFTSTQANVMVFLPGTYHVTITDESNGCSLTNVPVEVIQDCSSQVTSTRSSSADGAPETEPEPFLFDMIAFPNPFASETTIKLTIPTDEQVRLEVVDLSGKSVETLFDGPMLSNMDHTFRFVPEINFVEGMYLVRLTRNKKVYLYYIFLKR